MADHEERFSKGFPAFVGFVILFGILKISFDAFVESPMVAVRLVLIPIVILVLVYISGYIVTDMKDDIKSMRGDD